MKLKYEIADKIILLISCTIIFLLFHNKALSVIPILIALSISCFVIIYDRKLVFRLFFYSVYLIFSLFNDDLVFFIPLILYDVIHESNRFLLIPPLIPLSIFIPQSGLLDGLIMTVVIVIALFIRIKSSDAIHFKKRYYRLLDDTKELTAKLQKNNQSLLEKQDSDIYMATLNERNRIAREIHDHVGHQLSSAILQLGALLAITKDPVTHSHLQQLKKTLDLGMDNIRYSVHNLYDTSIDLDTKLKDIISTFTFCSLTYNNSLQQQPTQKQKLALIAIVKEALSNIIKHSNATHVDLILREHPGLYQLIICDNGSDMDLSLLNTLKLGMDSIESSSGIGLKNIEQRVLQLNGHLTIHTAKGFELFISLPKLNEKHTE